MFKGCGHEVVPEMRALALAWMDWFVKGDAEHWTSASGLRRADTDAPDVTSAARELVGLYEICQLYEASPGRSVAMPTCK